MNNFFNELKRRNVYKVAIAYAVTSWLLAQVVEFAASSFEAPPWVVKMIVVFLIIGFPVAILLAWAYEMSPQGMIRTNSVDAQQNPYPNKKKKPFTSNFVITILLFVIVSQFVYNRFNNNTQKTNIETSIAVLPFDDMTSSADSQWFCDGVTEDILTKLSKIKKLKVISRTSTERYKNTDKSVPEIAKELGVSYVVEGSVRKHNNEIMIAAQLIDASDNHIWAGNYNDKFDKVFDIQETVSKKIVEQLKIKISSDEEIEIAKYPTENMEAYQLYIRGISFLEKSDYQNTIISIDLFRKAIDHDPNFAEAYAKLGYALYNTTHPKKSDSIYKVIKQYYELALSINPNTSIGHSYLGYLQFRHEDKDIGFRNMNKAIELNPNNSKAHTIMSEYYENLAIRNKDLKEKYLTKALQSINKAIVLNPLSARVNSNKILYLIDLEMFDDAQNLFNNTKSLYSPRLVKYLTISIIQKKAIKIGVDNKNRVKTVEFLQEKVNKEPYNGKLVYLLATAYDGILNDHINYLKYAKRSYEIDSFSIDYAREYLFALSKNNLKNEIYELLDSKHANELVSKRYLLLGSYYSNYLLKNYTKAQEIIMDTTFKNFKNLRILVHAQLGEKEQAYKILRENKISINTKARIYAILKEKDSMYFYLQKKEMTSFTYNIFNVSCINGRAEFNPYRNEKTFKEILKKHYLPDLTE